MGASPAGEINAASSGTSATDEFVQAVAALVRVERRDEARSKDAGETLTRLIAAVHSATGWLKRERQFPLDRAEALLREAREASTIAPRIPFELPGNVI